MSGDGEEIDRTISAKVLPLIAAIAFGLAGIVGTQVLTKLTELETSVELLKIDVAVIKTDIQYMKLLEQAKSE